MGNYQTAAKVTGGSSTSSAAGRGPAAASSVPVSVPDGVDAPASGTEGESGSLPTIPAESDTFHFTHASVPLNVAGMPEGLALTLQHMVGQLDVLTQTMAAMHERLSMSEDRVRNIEDRLATALGPEQPTSAVRRDDAPAGH